MRILKWIDYDLAGPGGHRSIDTEWTQCCYAIVKRELTTNRALVGHFVPDFVKINDGMSSSLFSNARKKLREMNSRAANEFSGPVQTTIRGGWLSEDANDTGRSFARNLKNRNEFLAIMSENPLPEEVMDIKLAEPGTMFRMIYHGNTGVIDHQCKLSTTRLIRALSSALLN